MRYRFDPILSSLQNRTRYTRVYAKLAISVIASPPISRYVPPNRSFRQSYLRKFRKYTSTKRNIEISRGSADGAIVGGERLRRSSNAYISPRYCISFAEISLSVYFLQNEKKKETKNAKNLARGHPELIARLSASRRRDAAGGAGGNGGARASNRANTRHDVERVETIRSVLCHVRTDTETRREEHTENRTVTCKELQ